MMEHWHWWTLIALLLMIGEAVVPGLVLGSLAIGALAGGLSSAFTDWWEIQLVSASAGSIVALVLGTITSSWIGITGNPTLLK